MFARLGRIVSGLRVTDFPRAQEDMCQIEGETGTRTRRRRERERGEGRGERGEGKGERGEGERECVCVPLLQKCFHRRVSRKFFFVKNDSLRMHPRTARMTQTRRTAPHSARRKRCSCWCRPRRTGSACRGRVVRRIETQQHYSLVRVTIWVLVPLALGIQPLGCRDSVVVRVSAEIGPDCSKLQVPVRVHHSNDEDRHEDIKRFVHKPRTAPSIVTYCAKPPGVL